MPTTAPVRTAAGRRSCRAGPGRTGSRPPARCRARRRCRRRGRPGRCGPARRPAGTARPAGSRRRRRRRPGTAAAQGSGGAARPGTASTARSRRGSKTTTRASYERPVPCTRTCGARHAGHHVGVGDDPARDEHPAAALLAPVAGSRHPGDLDHRAGGTGHPARGGHGLVGPGHGRDRLDPHALEDAREALAVEHRAEAGEQAGGLGRDRPVDRLQDARRADGTGERRGRTVAHRAGDEPHQDRDRDQRGDAAAGRRPARGPASAGRAAHPGPHRHGQACPTEAITKTPKTSSTVCHMTLPPTPVHRSSSCGRATCPSAPPDRNPTSDMVLTSRPCR